MPKGGKVTNGGVVGNVYCKMQKFVLQKSEYKEFINKKNMYNINIFQISELCKSCKIFLINKVLKVVP